MSTTPFSLRQRVLSLAAGLILLSAVAAAFRLDADLVRARLDQAGPLAPLAFIILATGLMSLCIPKTIVSLSAGAVFGTAVGSLVLLAVATLAAALNYAIGYGWIGRASIRPLRAVDTRSGAVISVATDAGWLIHLLIRLSPLPTMLVSYSMGAIGARFRPYMLAAALAVIPQILWVHSGSEAVRAADAVDSTARWINLCLSLTFAVLVTIVIARQAQIQLAANIAVRREEHPASQRLDE